MERFGQLYGSSRYKHVFDLKFLEGLEKRRELLEGRNFKAIALQAPLFLLLAFALVNLDVRVSVAGFSVEGVRGLREILLIISSLLALRTSNLDRELGDVNEIMKSAVQKLSGGKDDVRNFLAVRYGIEEFSDARSFDQNLKSGPFQYVSAVLIALPVVLYIGALAVVGLGVQILTLREILIHPNFSFAVSVCVVAFVLSVDVVIGVMGWLRRGIQPFRTSEDMMKLSKLDWKDKARYDAIIYDIVMTHKKKGPLMRLLTRPKMKRID
jgi:hypothetical protein